jgi:hypothetical protein
MSAVDGALAELYEALDNRALVESTEVARAAAETRVGRAVAALGTAAWRPDVDRLESPPPAAVGKALARALFDVPHVNRTFGGETTLNAYAPFRPSNALADALGVTRDEMEEMREDVDRVAAGVLKQMRLLSWLWMRSGDPSVRPQALWGTLFPVDGGQQPVRFLRRGARLYPVFAGVRELPTEALYLPWVGGDAGAERPLGGFQARYVDDATLRSIQRGLGTAGDEARRLLDNLVCPLPGSDVLWLKRDRWRSEGWSDLCGLGVAADSTAWLTLPIARDGIDLDGFFELGAEGIIVRAPRRVFDRHAMARVGAVMRGLYAELCARVLSGEPLDPARQSAMFDLGTAIHRVLQPLLDWAASPATQRHVSEHLGVTLEAAGTALEQVREVWVRSAHAAWAGRPDEDRPHTVQTILTTHLALVQSSLYRIWRRQPDGRGSHQRVMLLFLGHYFSEAPLGRLWRTTEKGDLVPVEDVLGDWFWGSWRRSLDALGYDD